jgi:hypothetical protein
VDKVEEVMTGQILLMALMYQTDSKLYGWRMEETCI